MQLNEKHLLERTAIDLEEKAEYARKQATFIRYAPRWDKATVTAFRSAARSLRRTLAREQAK